MSSVESTPLWYRVADLKIQLRDHVNIHRHHYRGNLWYVVHDTISNRHYRFGRDAYQLIRQLNGKDSIESIFQRLKNAVDDITPKQDEIISLLAHLHASDLIRSDIPADTSELFNRYETANGPTWKKYIKGPLLIRLPLFDPNNTLNHFAKLTDFIFGRLGYLTWLLVVAIAAVLSLSQWTAYTEYWIARTLAPYNVLILAIAYPVIKAIHEFAHGLAVKRWGGEVHEMGVMFMIFMPLPYIDASASTAFQDKHQRILVSAAGILTETFLAAIACIVWSSVETGLIRDIAYDVMLIGGISTVFFNGNPLLRFDGYYVLSDAIEIPNLAQRSTKYYGYLVQKYLFRIINTKSPVTVSSEQPWLLGYGISSTLYRLFILGTIVLFLFDEYLIIGLALGTLAVFLQIVLPLSKQIQFVLGNPLLQHRRFRAVSTVSALFGLLFVGVFLVPLPTSTYSQGIVWLPEDAQIRASVDGFIEKVLYDPQTKVTAETPLIETSNTLLRIKVERLQWQLKELKARFDQQLVMDRVEAEILEREIQNAVVELTHAQQEATSLILLSPTEGTFLLSKAHHILGRYVRKGEVLGYVTDLSEPTVRAVVRQTDIALVRDKTTSVTVRLADNPRQTLSARIIHHVPSATSQLPDESLGTLGGGLITVDPKDSSGTTSTEEFFLIDIAMPNDLSVQRVGTRVHIRFEHEYQPLAQRIYRKIRQLFLKRFTV